MQRFYWLVDGAIAGCSRPGGPGTPGSGGDGEIYGADRHIELEADLAWLGSQGIGAVLSLTEEPLPAEALRRHELEVLHLPVVDLTPPSPHQFQVALDFIDRARSHGKGVAVHCLMGQGRTGTILAAHLIRTGTQAQDAVDHLRTICPGALSSPSQEHALAEYGARRDWVL